MRLLGYLKNRSRQKTIEALANLLVDICQTDKALMIMTSQCKFTPLETNRFLISAVIFNYIIASMFISIRIKEGDSAELITHIFDKLQERLTQSRERIRLGDIIVYKPELDFMEKKYNLSENSMLDYDKLFSAICSYRYKIYNNMLIKACDEAYEYKSSLKMFLLIDEFIRHFMGKENIDEVQALPITALLELFHKEIINYCDSYIL